MTLVSNPAGVVPCDACLTSANPTITVDDGGGGGGLTACDGCREKYEIAGNTTNRAVELAITGAIGPGKVERRDAVIRIWRHRIGKDRQDPGGQKHLLDVGQEEARLGRRKRRRVSAAAA